jgi:hypothetical protein
MDVVNFELITRQGGITDNHRILSVIRSGNEWKCYQTDYKNWGLSTQINDTVKTFIKTVQSKILEKLLAIVAKEDTVINVDRFKISNTKLKAYIDTVRPNLKPQQKSEFIKAIRSKTIVKDALNKALHPIMMDDRNYYAIIITTRSAVKDTIDAYSFVYLYDLPWYINHNKCYDPNISLIFNFISNENWYKQQEEHWMYRNIVENIYRKYFK